MTDAPPQPLSRWRILLGMPLLVALTLGIHAVIHRVRLAQALAAMEPDGTFVPWRVALRGAWQDVAVAVVAAAVVTAVAWLGRRWIRRDGIRLAIGLGLVAPLVLAIGANCQTHLQTLQAMRCGLSWSLIAEALGTGQPSTILTMATTEDTVFIALPWVMLVALALFMRHRPRLTGALTGTVLASLSAGAVLLGHSPPEGFPPETADSPVAFTATEVVHHLASGESEDGEVAQANPKAPAGMLGGLLPTAFAAAPSEDGGGGGEPAEEAELPTDASVAQQQDGGMRMYEPQFGALPSVARQAPPPSDRKWNIVWLVLESHGRRYLQGEATKGVQPMPYLVENLAKRGWWLARHRSPSNSSATSIFTQFSGLYPLPSTRMFAVQRDNHIPSLFSLLGADYERFLVTPGNLDFFFPRHFLNNGGLQELTGFAELSGKIRAQGDTINQIRDEFETVSYFIERLRKAKPPFAAVYYSFTPHWEYHDFGPKWHRFKGNRPIDRYLNGLYVMDTQIQRIVEYLEQSGMMDSTILVLAGDHGEAFGQHPANYNHSRASFDENYSTPALIVQPKLFAPKVIDYDTLHTDLLPTVLDAMGVAYDDALLQGESLWQQQPRRKYQFFWGNEGTVTALRSDGLKVQMGLTDHRCWAYRLGDDPGERKRLTCQEFADDVAVLKAWRDRQRRLLPAYSKAVREGVAFQGHRHPQPGTPQPAEAPAAK